ncbi:hypothetical protein LZ31DRAFT_302773 [Colletotrichum somersetense]|nr:hypothetical protein LZ31DRAFT_302773 [Colletotrichum somersetense]
MYTCYALPAIPSDGGGPAFAPPLPPPGLVFVPRKGLPAAGSTASPSLVEHSIATTSNMWIDNCGLSALEHHPLPSCLCRPSLTLRGVGSTSFSLGLCGIWFWPVLHVACCICCHAMLDGDIDTGYHVQYVFSNVPGSPSSAIWKQRMLN